MGNGRGGRARGAGLEEGGRIVAPQAGFKIDGKQFVVDKFHRAPHHYIKVVSTRFESWGGIRSYQITHQSWGGIRSYQITHQSRGGIRSYQITHQNREANIGRRDTPQAKFSYDLAPVEKKWYDFITSVLAIVGGSFT
eukprot:gene30671-51425_t